MPTVIEIRRTYKYRLYENAKKNQLLHNRIDIAGLIRNHAIALQRRYYRLTGKYIPLGHMKSHIKDLRMKTERFVHWKLVGSQAVQDILERLDASYQRFFKKQGGLPRFRKVKKHKSFTLKETAGWKVGEDTHQRGSKKHPKHTGHVRIMGEWYKFVKHRPMKGIIKTVTIKRDVAGRLWVCFSVIEKIVIEDKTSTGKIGGFDFGLKHFLTNDEGQFIDAPEFFKQDLPRVRKIQSQVSKKVDGSNNQRKGKRHIARRHIRIADKRRDFQYQLANDLCRIYDVMIFEDLNISAMKRLWGRKVSDLGFAKFVEILQFVALKRGKQVVFIDRWERTTGKCSHCGHKQKLELKERTFKCDECDLILDRDHNAALNILEAGHRLMLSESDNSQTSLCVPMVTTDATRFS